MNHADFSALLPLIIVSASAIIVMLAIAIRRNHKAAIMISLVGLVTGLGSLASGCPFFRESLLLSSSSIPTPSSTWRFSSLPQHLCSYSLMTT